ncbi:alpha/beta hydrolase [Candidatus Thorarchaeota archaeon]|nr:MAG: alpha/beta hydrolase [Candidatus Thorarchaeota archaeon]
MPLIQTGNIQTYYELHGGNGPVIVFIHGAGASHDMWKPQVEYFSNTFRTLTYDIRGHQQSEGSDDNYTCELFADDLNQLLQQLDIREPVVCGLSLGGMIAQEYAIKYQSNLKGLILADTAVASALTLSDKLLKAMYPKSMVRWTIKRMSDEKYADWSFKYFDMDDDVREYLKQEQLKLKKEELLKITDAIYSFKLLPLENIKVPTLVIVGENERKAVFPHVDKMVELIPNAKRVVIPGAGHASNLENPEVFNREIEDFLRGLVVSSS